MFQIRNREAEAQQALERAESSAAQQRRLVQEAEKLAPQAERVTGRIAARAEKIDVSFWGGSAVMEGGGGGRGGGLCMF